MAESSVPLKLRKEMLVMRAAVERVELAHHMLDLRRASTMSAIVRNAMPGDRSRSVASRLFEMVKRYPFVASAASLLAARFKFPVVVAATKWGGIATIGYKVWELWQKHHPDGASRTRPLVPRSRRLP
jgi:threonine/homoserine/homoserine lactone efflux protein